MRNIRNPNSIALHVVAKRLRSQLHKVRVASEQVSAWLHGEIEKLKIAAINNKFEIEEMSDLLKSSQLKRIDLMEQIERLHAELEDMRKTGATRISNGTFEKEDPMTLIEKPSTPCRRCVECVDEEHHWMPEPEHDLQRDAIFFECRHCPATCAADEGQGPYEPSGIVADPPFVSSADADDLFDEALLRLAGVPGSGVALVNMDPSPEAEEESRG